MKELPKSSAGCSSGDKYLIDCSERITQTKTTENWLENMQYIQTVSMSKSKMSDKKILEGILDKNKDVVVKIAKTKETSLKHEWRTFKQLKSHKIPNILHYYCYFECADDFREIDPIHTKQKHICKSDGSGIHVLIMDYVKNKNFAEYEWKQNDADKFIVCCKQVVYALAEAYATIGFRHGNCHTKNILIKPTSCSEIEYTHIGKKCKIPKGGFKIVIMDFELSQMNAPKQRHHKDIDEFFNSIYKHFENIVNIQNIVAIKKYLAEEENKGNMYDLDHLITLIDNIQFNVVTEK